MAPKNKSIYGAFAAGRLAIARLQLEISSRYRPEWKFWFGRIELHIALLVMMENYYSAATKNDPDEGASRLTILINQMPCSYTTARRLIDDAVEEGYLNLKPSKSDHRVKVVTPTERTIKIWEAHFDESKTIMEDTGLIEMLIEEQLGAQKDKKISRKS